ncbi:hypothetical protein Clacol_001627 [Clathrus columnatus]|uniref:Prolactin regulatory element-binding protein n=1 Tax=Clathrus columnatus TaxID=1419009 RepID=A0AAV4ZZP6_9AGAM|nr:hypothetical protein Clacol_001627 [Clathrus columnatus]
MRTQHFLYTVPNFPIYSAAFISNDVLVLGGGGGSSKTGVKNMIRLYKVQSSGLDMKLLDEYSLCKEDTPMSMSAHRQRSEIVCGINGLLDDTSSNSKEIENCRAFAVSDAKIRPLNTRTTFKAKTPEDYQNVTVFSPEHDFLAIGSTTNELIMVATTRLDVYSLPITGSSKRLVKTVTAAMASIPGLTFRAARFDPKQPQYIYTIMNAAPSRSGRKVSSRYSYLLKWNMEDWRVVKTRQVVDKAVTCFDMSGTKARTPFLTILKAHEFPPTVIRFSPDGSLLISASFDNTVRVIAIPEKSDTGEHRLHQFKFVLKISSLSYVKELVCLDLDVGNSVIRSISTDNSGFGLNQRDSLIFAVSVTLFVCLLCLRIKIDA